MAGAFTLITVSLVSSAVEAIVTYFTVDKKETIETEGQIKNEVIVNEKDSENNILYIILAIVSIVEIINVICGIYMCKKKAAAGKVNTIRYTPPSEFVEIV